MTESREHHDVAEVVHCRTEFEAHAKAAVLAEAGIEARVVTDGPSWAGMMRLSRTEHGAGVWVPREALESARAALAQNVADSVDLDWDEVDVGQVEDDVPGAAPGRTPWPARIAWWVAAATVITGASAALVAISRGW